MLTHNAFLQSMSGLLEEASDASFLLAVSGGADSMVLLDLFAKSDWKFEVAHVNYRLRGEESDSDRKTVESYCAQNRIKFHCYEVSSLDQKPDNSIQNWARNLRYRFFRKIQQEDNLRYLVTAHHLNDQLETFIINLSKAAGIKGLTGIPANENGILRPLLTFSKEEIYAFAAHHKINFREDLSNQSNDYLRNFIRNEISPKLLRTNKDFLNNFSKSLYYLNQARHFTEQKIAETEATLITRHDAGIFIDRKKLSVQHPLVKFEVLSRFGFYSRKEIDKILRAPTGKIYRSSTHQLKVDRSYFILNAKAEHDISSSDEEILITGSDVASVGLTVHLSKFLPGEDHIPATFLWEFDAERVHLPLKLRHRQKGDVFFPTGMTGRKKISKFFKDEKIPTFVQHGIWLLCDGNNDILGVIPLRQDRRFLAKEQSKIVIKF